MQVIYAINEDDRIKCEYFLWKLEMYNKIKVIPSMTFVEEDDSREKFERMLKFLEKGDTVVVTSIGALDDGSDFSLMQKIRKLEGRGVKLLSTMELDFSYGVYEKWYKVQKEREEYNRFYDMCFKRKYNF